MTVSASWIAEKRSIEGNYISVKIGNRRVDEGAVVSIVSERLTKQLKLSIRPITIDEKMNIFSADAHKFDEKVLK